MKKRYAPGCVVMLILSVFCMVSCHMKLEPATVLIVDPVRHYYPVIQGDMMEIRYAIENTSSNPLFIEEIQTSCGCIVPRGELPIVVLPHKVGNVNITYNTIKTATRGRSPVPVRSSVPSSKAARSPSSAVCRSGASRIPTGSSSSW